MEVSKKLNSKHYTSTNLIQNKNELNNKYNFVAEKKSTKFKKNLSNLNLEVFNSYRSRKSKNFTKKKSSKNIVLNEEDMNFYNKMRTIHGNNISVVCNKFTTNKPNLLKKKKSYLDVVSHNLFEDGQALKNPQTFYANFFASLIEKQNNVKRIPSEK